MPCRYSEIFGKVGEGGHSYRMFDIAIVDVVFTIIGAYIIHMALPSYRFSYILITVQLSLLNLISDWYYITSSFLC